jgi:hypothetical protein
MIARLKIAGNERELCDDKTEVKTNTSLKIISVNVSFFFFFGDFGVVL